MGKKGWDAIRAVRLQSEAHKRELERGRRFRAKPEYKGEHAAYMRETREARRKAHICISCGRNDTFYDKSRCPACLEREVINRSKRRKNNGPGRKNAWIL